MPHTNGHVAAAAQTGGCAFVPATWAGFPPQIQRHGDFLYLRSRCSKRSTPPKPLVDKPRSCRSGPGH